MRLINTIKSISRNRRGSTLVEAVLSVSIVSIALIASGSVMRSIRVAEQSAENKFQLSVTITASRAAAAQRITAQWESAANNNCTIGDDERARTIASAGPSEGLRLLDSAELDAVLQEDLKEEIEKVRTTYADDAFSKCSDTEALSEADLTLIASSHFNQALCRCAVAKTAYGTLNAPISDLSKQKGYYGCIQADSNTAFSSAIFEMVAYSTDVATSSRLDCSALSTSVAGESISRVDYVAALKAAATERVSGTYFLPSSGVSP